MYLDHRPPQASPKCPSYVTVIEVDKDFPIDIDETVKTATRGEDDYDTIWVVFSDEPRRAWDFTERSLRSTLAGRNRKARAQDRAAAEHQPSDS